MEKLEKKMSSYRTKLKVEKEKCTKKDNIMTMIWKLANSVWLFTDESFSI